MFPCLIDCLCVCVLFVLLLCFSVGVVRLSAFSCLCLFFGYVFVRVFFVRVFVCFLVCVLARLIVCVS